MCQARETRVLAAMESQWQGRAGGLDRGVREEAAPVRRKKVQRGDLAPIEDILLEANLVRRRCCCLI